MFLVSVPQGPTHLINVLHCASQMVTVMPVYNPSFVGDDVLILAAINRSLTVLSP